jgi:hypothetical protein
MGVIVAPGVKVLPGAGTTVLPAGNRGCKSAGDRPGVVEKPGVVITPRVPGPTVGGGGIVVPAGGMTMPRGSAGIVFGGRVVDGTDVIGAGTTGTTGVTG